MDRQTERQGEKEMKEGRKNLQNKTMDMVADMNVFPINVLHQSESTKEKNEMTDTT